jgi:hypothetical protein
MGWKRSNGQLMIGTLEMFFKTINSKAPWKPHKTIPNQMTATRVCADGHPFVIRTHEICDCSTTFCEWGCHILSNPPGQVFAKKGFSSYYFIDILKIKHCLKNIIGELD